MAEPIDKDTRGPVNLRIKFRSESLQQFIERYGVDVSRGGIFIRTREPLPVGTRLKLDFQLVDTAPLFQGDGTVVWIREHDPSRAGVTPGMGVRFDRLSPESQTTLDTILEEKIRLQQSGVAPGSVAKAGAGIAVRRMSGAFATVDAQAAKPGAPPLLPVEVKLDSPIKVHMPAAPPLGAAPASPMPMTSSRSGPHATGSSSIFTRPRTTSGVRPVVPSALFEPPTAADIDKALSALEEKGGPPPALPNVPTVVKSELSRGLGDDEPTKVFDSAAEQELSAESAVTGEAEVLSETAIPIEAEGGSEGDLTERRFVDPADGQVKSDVHGAAALGGNGAGATSRPAPPLDAPLSSLVDSGAAPSAKPPTRPPTKPAAVTGKPGVAGVPMKITTDRAQATESGRFRSDTRYKRRRGNGIYWALAVLVVGAGVGAGGFYYKRERERRAAAAQAAAAAAPPFAAGQNVTAPPQQPPPTATPPGAGGGPAAPLGTTAGGTEAPDKAQAAKPEETGAKAQVEAKTETKTETKAEARPEKQARPEKPEGQSPGRSRKREKSASAAADSNKAGPAKPEAPVADKAPEGDKGGAEAAKPAGDSAKVADTGKTAETAKPADGDKGGGEATKAGEKTAEGAAAAPALTERPILKITSSPAGADVVIDGVPVGTTPFSSKDVSADGTHAISVKKDGYETHERMISGSDWSRGRGGTQSLKFNVKLKKTGGDQKPADTGEKKPPDVEILTPSDP